MKTAKQCTATVCEEFTRKGFCLRGEFCPFTHGSDAVSVSETEFFYEWETVESTWLLRQLEHHLKRLHSQKSKGKKKKPNVVQKNQMKTVRLTTTTIENHKPTLEEERKRIKEQIERQKKEIARKRKLEIEETLKRSARQESVQKKENSTTTDEEDDVLKALNAEIEGKPLPQIQQKSLQPIPVKKPSPPPIQNKQEDEDDEFAKYKNVNFEHPIIPFSIDFTIPRHFRQTVLDKLVEAFLKKESNRKRAVVNAIEKELEFYNKCKNKSTYWNQSINFIKRLNK